MIGNSHSRETDFYRSCKRTGPSQSCAADFRSGKYSESETKQGYGSCTWLVNITLEWYFPSQMVLKRQCFDFYISGEVSKVGDLLMQDHLSLGHSKSYRCLVPGSLSCRSGFLYWKGYYNVGSFALQEIKLSTTASFQPNGAHCFLHLILWFLGRSMLIRVENS